MKLESGEIIITCPKCGAEYLPAEIYYPNEFLGKPYGIDKLDGKIENYLGNSMNLKESYQCDHCNCKFNVTAKVSFKSTELNKFDTTKDYKTQLFEPKLTLFEGD